MSSINYYLQYIPMKLIALIPLQVLYGFSSGLYFLLYYVAGYRKKVVRDNLQRSFPAKSAKERREIEKAFFRHFSDLIVENIKMINMTPDSLCRRMTLVNPEILDKYRDSGRSIVAVGGHYGNWEWTLGIVQYLKYKTIGVYKPLSNKGFDRLVSHSRSKFGSEMVGMREIVRVLFRYKTEKIPTFNVLVADQSPVWQEIQYWLPFLNQITPVYLGPEKIAKQFDMVVLFGKVKKTGRGRYTLEFIPVEENPGEAPDHSITAKFISLLEEQIIERPEFWLWSHRRWKHTRRREEEESKGIFRFNENHIRI